MIRDRVLVANDVAVLIVGEIATSETVAVRANGRIHGGGIARDILGERQSIAVNINVQIWVQLQNEPIKPLFIEVTEKSTQLSSSCLTSESLGYSLQLHATNSRTRLRG